MFFKSFIEQQFIKPCKHAGLWTLKMLSSSFCITDNILFFSTVSYSLYQNALKSHNIQVPDIIQIKMITGNVGFKLAGQDLCTVSSL